MEQTVAKKIVTYQSALKGFAMSFTHNEDNANDLVQDTMMKAVRYSDKFQDGTNLQGWLFTIMRNTFINDYRKNLRKNSLVEQGEELSSWQLMTSSHANRASSKMAMDDIQKALALVPEKPRYAFVRYFEGYKYEEIAAELNIPLGTVKTYIHTARKLLKSSLSMYKDKLTA